MAEQAVHFIGRLYRERGVITTLYNRPLVGRTPMQILQEHKYVADVETNDFSIQQTFPLLSAMADMELSPARIDMAKLSSIYDKNNPNDISSFLKDELADSLNGDPLMLEKPQDVVLYGFGRIGRLVARLLMERAGNGEGLRLKAIVVRKGKGDDLAKRASLLMRDSVHGSFNGTIEVDRETNSIIANGHVIQVIYASSPDQIDYGQYGIQNALICDNTGVWRMKKVWAHIFRQRGQQSTPDRTGKATSRTLSTALTTKPSTLSATLFQRRAGATPSLSVKNHGRCVWY